MKIGVSFVSAITMFLSSVRVSLAFVPRRSTTATTAAAVSKKFGHHSRLSASFFDDLQRGFASMTGGGDKNDNDSPYYTVGITGASGLVGSALRNELSRRDEVNGKPVRVVSLVRGTSVSPLNENDNTAVWNPAGTTADDVLDPTAAAQLDAVVHLAGENVSTGTGPLGFTGIQAWSQDKKDLIMSSRVGPTEAISKVVASSRNDGPKVFLSASGIGAYGDQFVNDELQAVDEKTDITNAPGFLAQVSRAWEAATSEAVAAKNTRVVNMRFGVVLSKQGGALGKLFPIFFLGGGGNVGSGQQYFSFVSARDLARGIIYALETPSLQGPVNFSAPNPCTNAEFTAALGKNMGRPTILPLPAFVVKAVFGEMGEEMLLGGVRAVPSKLVESGFEFQHPTIDDAVKSALEEEI